MADITHIYCFGYISIAIALHGNVTLQKSAQIVLNHCKSLSVMIHLHHFWYLKPIQIISHSAKQSDLKKMIEWRFYSWKAWFIMEIFILHLVLSHQMDVWFNDGMTTGRRCEKDGVLETMSSRKLMKWRGKKLVLAIYTLVWLIWYCVLKCFRYKLNGRKFK